MILASILQAIQNNKRLVLMQLKHRQEIKLDPQRKEMAASKGLLSYFL